MAMSEREVLDLLQYVQRGARASELGDFDDAVMSDMRREELSPQRMLLAYLEALDTELALRSAATARLAVNRLNEFAYTYEETPVEGVEVRLGAADARLTDEEAVDLTEDLPDLRRERAELRELLATLREQLGGDFRG